MSYPGNGSKVLTAHAYACGITYPIREYGVSYMDKLIKLKQAISRMGSVLVAYSGGTDSTFLLKVCSDILKDKCLAVTADSPAFPKAELLLAKKTAGDLGVRHKVVQSKELGNKKFRENSPKRCYFCKKELFSRLKKIAKLENLRFVIDASNYDDEKDFRPGNQAKKELGVRSPLQEAGLSKKEIRNLSKKLGLRTWNKPSLACLASRIAYGVRITPAILQRIDQAESIIRRLGFLQVRVRHYNGLCRIETEKKDIPRLLNNRAHIVDKLKKLGYNYITVDLEGFRSGSLNEIITKSKPEFL